MDLKREAQERSDRIRAFREQLAELERDQVLALSQEQSDRVNSHLEDLQKKLAAEFDIDTTAGQKQLSLAMKFASAFGGLALCIGVFLFFYRFWGDLTTPVQVTILILAPLICLAAMAFTAPRERTRYFTGLIGMIAIAAFVLDLTVLGQIFNIAPSPNALLAWGVFSIILAYSYRLRWLLAIGLVGVTAWLGLSIAAWTGVYWSEGFSRPENFLIPALAIILGALQFDDEFSDVYRLTGWLILLITVFFLGVLGTSYLRLEEKSIRTLYQFAGLAVSGCAIWLGIRGRWRAIVNAGAAFFAIFLLMRLADWWWDWMPRYLFFLVLGAIAIGLLVLFRKLRPRMEAA